GSIGAIRWALFPAGDGHPFYIGVEWSAEPRNQLVPGPPLAIDTLYETAAKALERLAPGRVLTIADGTAPADPAAALSDSDFVLERYLEDFIVSNFDSIFRGRLRRYSDGNHNLVGQQFPTDVRPIGHFGPRSHQQCPCSHRAQEGSRSRSRGRTDSPLHGLGNG